MEKQKQKWPAYECNFVDAAVYMKWQPDFEKLLENGLGLFPPLRAKLARKSNCLKSRQNLSTPSKGLTPFLLAVVVFFFLNGDFRDGCWGSGRDAFSRVIWPIRETERKREDNIQHECEHKSATSLHHSHIMTLPNQLSSLDTNGARGTQNSKRDVKVV